MPCITELYKYARNKSMASKKENRAVDVFLMSIKDLPGNANPMVVINKTKYMYGIKNLSETRIDSLPTRVLRDIKEDINWALAQQIAKRRAFSSLFRSKQNAESENRKAATKRLRVQRATKKKKAS